MDRWHFPDNLVLPSRFHHKPDQCPPGFQQHAFIIELADLISLHAGVGYGGSPMLPKMGKYREIIGIGRDEIKKNIEERDHQDVNRKESPLAKADDAVELDNSNMTPAEQMVWFKMIISRIPK